MPLRMPGPCASSTGRRAAAAVGGRAARGARAPRLQEARNLGTASPHLSAAWDRPRRRCTWKNQSGQQPWPAAPQARHPPSGHLVAGEPRLASLPPSITLVAGRARSSPWHQGKRPHARSGGARAPGLSRRASTLPIVPALPIAALLPTVPAMGRTAPEARPGGDRLPHVTAGLAAVAFAVALGTGPLGTRPCSTHGLGLVLHLALGFRQHLPRTRARTARPAARGRVARGGVEPPNPRSPTSWRPPLLPNPAPAFT